MYDRMNDSYSDTLRYSDTLFYSDTLCDGEFLVLKFWRSEKIFRGIVDNENVTICEGFTR